ncbi:MAG TPA: NAD-dependent epimerase/dehydratase family protein [Nitrososphaerales archaeon]|nr:NAD-dependent epimerase/dehydratase family protein [Nitrososphaerales archaeon]
MNPTVLVTGSEGQIGSELTDLLRERCGRQNVVAGSLAAPSRQALDDGPAEQLDVTQKGELERVVKGYRIDTIYHLAAVLSAVGENDPQLAWSVNMQGLKNVLDVSKESGISRVFWPSSIAVFGPDAPKRMTPQDTPLNPTTMYGVTKVSGELLCRYYSLKFGVDVRCVRFPGLISNKTRPGGGTTDYAVEIFYSAIDSGRYTCFVRADTMLPMMYMPDALRGAMELMEAPSGLVKRHSGYNLAAMSFSASELAAEIAKHLPAFVCDYRPDSRQVVADGWPESVSDVDARRDWGWVPRYDLAAMTEDMILKLTARLKGKPKKG